MRIFKIILIFGAFIFSSCTDQKSMQELETVKQELELQKTENKNLLAQMETNKDNTNQFVHYVFLDVKDDISDKQYEFLIKEIKSLSKIPGVHDFEVGLHENMDDDRAMEQREINFGMRFEKKMDYYNYQKSNAHIRIRELLAPFMAKPPLTYDYLVQ